MTNGERFVESLPKKTRFYDRNERRTYALTSAVAARLIDDEELVRSGLSHARKHMGSDPSQSKYLALWEDLLTRDVREIVKALLEDTPRGALLRNTQPVFVVFPDALRRRILASQRNGAVIASA